MTKPIVFVTCAIPDAGIELLRTKADVHVNMEDRVLSRGELISGLAQADGLLCQLADAVDAEVISSAPRLKAIANYAVGFNNIDLAAASARGIPVTNTPGVLTEATADLAWALLMCAARRVVEGDEMVRQGRFHGWGPRLLLGADVYGATLGLIGLGRIGTAVARRARGFDMRVVYHSRTRLQSKEEAELGLTYLDLPELLGTSDFVSLHVPLTADTRHMIGAQQLRMMKSSAILINTARGPVVDEAALAEALACRRLAAAGLDVYENEPAVHPDLLGLDNVVLLPHVGSGTLGTRSRMAIMAAESMISMLDGGRPSNIVNP